MEVERFIVYVLLITEMHRLVKLLLFPRDLP